MELIENKTYSTAEMREFFGVSKDNWKKQRDKLLLHLTHYYEYEREYDEQDRRKVNYHIHKKLQDYKPPERKRERQNALYCKKIIEVIKRDNLQTAKNISRIIKDDKEIMALNHKDGTIYEYTRVNMRNMFGDSVEGNLKGIISEKIWCRADIEHNCYIPLTENQIQYLYDRIHQYKEVQEKELKACIDYDNNLITEAERSKLVKESSLQCFLDAKKDFKQKYGHFPIKVPRYQLSAF